jgi:hypothetical protein
VVQGQLTLNQRVEGSSPSTPTNKTKYCVKDVMADPAAAAELQVKRTVDFDDVVRDYRKRVDLTNLGFQFNRDCGKAIEAIMAKPATKS